MSEFVSFFLLGLAKDIDMPLELLHHRIEDIWQHLCKPTGHADLKMEETEMSRWYSLYSACVELDKVWALRLMQLCWSRWHADGKNPFEHMAFLVQKAPPGLSPIQTKELLKHHQPDVVLRILMKESNRRNCRSVILVFAAPKQRQAWAVTLPDLAVGAFFFSASFWPGFRPDLPLLRRSKLTPR